MSSQVLLKVPEGAILSLFAAAWERGSADFWVTQVIKEGYSIPFLFRPPLLKSPVIQTTFSLGLERFAALEAEVSFMLLLGAIEEASSDMEGFYNPLFVVTLATWGLDDRN